MTMTEDERTETTRRTVFRTIAAAAGLGVLPASAAAQEGSATPPGSSSPSPTPEGEEVVIQLDASTRLTDWEFSDGTFSLTFDCEVPESIKVTDSGAVMKAWEGGGDGGGAVSIPTEGFSLSSGTTTVEFGATVFDEAAAVTIASADGTAFVFSEGIDRGGVSVELSTAMAGGAAAAVGSGALSYRQTKNALEDEDEPNAERII